MPLIDLPLPALQSYQGRNPKPADFDAYWQHALDALAATPAQARLAPAREISPRHARAHDLWFTGVGGAQLHAKLLRPAAGAAAAPGPALLMFHGYGHHSGDWADKLAWVYEGFTVAALDCRGQGGASADPGGVQGSTHAGHVVRGLADADPQRLLLRSHFLDTVQLARYVMTLPEVDEARVAAFGVSQGGGLALACAALEPRIARCAAVYPFLCDYQRVWEMDLARGAYDELRIHFRHHDPRHEREPEIFTRLGYVDAQHLAPRIRAELLMFTGLADTVCPPSTQFAAYNKVASPKRMVVYPDFGHETLPGLNDELLAFLQPL